jgi:O-methyltransferase/8-demethyl-8-(2,3-dimethoxy-alpha-L-rhamnosyl)tetracenomycin-C 4'-O-methyltransferase
VLKARLKSWLGRLLRHPNSHRERDLYLDLLEKVLINSIYEDAALPFPKRKEKFNKMARRRGKDWPSLAHSMVGKIRLHNVRVLAQRTLDEGIPGDYIETGVWRGGCCILMSGVLKANRDKTRKVYVADSFAGLPPPNPDDYPIDRGDELHKVDVLAVPLEEVRENFRRYGLLNQRVEFVEGLFKNTLPKLEAGPFALMRLDGDMYESTIQALDALYPKLSPGGFVIIDDYALKGCRAAVDDYRRDHSITAPLNEIDWTGVWWQKTAS